MFVRKNERNERLIGKGRLLFIELLTVLMFHVVESVRYAV